MVHGFFTCLNNTWNQDCYSEARRTYRDLAPCKTNTYFSHLHSIMETTSLAASLIHSPLWLALNTVLHLVKAVYNLIIAAVLLPITLAAMVIEPEPKLCTSLKSKFNSALANSLVASTMTVLAALATVASLFLKPLQIASNVLTTVFNNTDYYCPAD